MKQLFKIDKVSLLKLSYRGVFAFSLALIFVAAGVLVSSLTFSNLFSLDKTVKELKAPVKKEKPINIDGILKLFETQNEKEQTLKTETQEQNINTTNYKILGTIFTDRGRFLIVSSEDGKWKLLKEGDILNGKRIVKVAKTYYEIKDGRSIKRISIFSESEIKQEERRKIPPAYDRENDRKRVIKISKTTVLKETEDIGKLLSQVVIVPVIRNGETIGYQFKRIARNSILRKIGFRNGDIILAVNGVPVKTADDAFKIYNMMRNENTLEVEMERRGRREVVIYEIR